MKRLRLYMIVFGVLVSLPLAFVAWRTYGALDREVQAQVRFFSERLLDEIEGELADLVRREENRAVDEYHHTLVQESGTIRSPLAQFTRRDVYSGVFPEQSGRFLPNPAGGGWRGPACRSCRPGPAASGDQHDFQSA